MIEIHPRMAVYWSQDEKKLLGPSNSEADSPDLSFIPIGDYRFCFAMSKRHLLSGRKSLGFKDLVGETLMIMKKGSSSINDRVRKTSRRNTRISKFRI